MLGIMELFSSSGSATALPFFLPLGIVGLVRLVLFAIRLVMYLLYKPVRPSSANVYTSSDVTIIVPTIDAGPEFRKAAEQWLKNKPYEIIVVTTHPLRQDIQAIVDSIGEGRWLVLSVAEANKRVQLVEGINAAKTEILALSDDDAIWTDEFLLWTLAPFDDPKMGGVGSGQTMTPCGESATIWEKMADMRLSMRMMEASSTTYVDGGISCLSGRTALYRRDILVDDEFQARFVSEKWLGKYALHSGDDKFITRWLVAHDWNMQFQKHKRASLETTFKPNWMFLKQLLRWTRNTWRSDFTSLFIDGKIWRRYPYVAFNMLDKMVNPITLLSGPILIALAMLHHPRWSPWQIIATEICWVFFSRYLRLIEHWRRRQWDIVHLPLYIAFSYFFALMKVYALLTLHITGWATRAGADVNDDELSNMTISVLIDEADAEPIKIEEIQKGASADSFRVKPSLPAAAAAVVQASEPIPIVAVAA